ncbi:MAG: hypothetical protein V3U74_03255 [Thermodesulfobacteriota bacterium]
MRKTTSLFLVTLAVSVLYFSYPACAYKSIIHSLPRFSEDIAAVLIKDKWGFIDKTDKWIWKPRN